VAIESSVPDSLSGDDKLRVNSILIAWTSFMRMDEILAKAGPELFKELLRYYPVGEYEDYFKNGHWKNDQMRIDLQLYLAHRNEAGAPEPIALEDVKMPEIPDVKPTGMPSLTAKVLGVGPVVTTGAKPALVATPVGLTGAAGDLREIALFVSKFKLDPSKAKMVLAPLLPMRRKYVLTNFKSEKSGAEGMEELEKYLKECEENKKWDSGVTVTAGTAPAAGAAGTAPAGTVGATAPATNGPVSVVPKALVGTPRQFQASRRGACQVIGSANRV